jgi:hypothetical protein
MNVKTMKSKKDESEIMVTPERPYRNLKPLIAIYKVSCLEALI